MHNATAQVLGTRNQLPGNQSSLAIFMIFARRIMSFVAAVVAISVLISVLVAPRGSIFCRGAPPHAPQMGTVQEIAARPSQAELVRCAPRRVAFNADRSLMNFNADTTSLMKQNTRHTVQRRKHRCLQGIDAPSPRPRVCEVRVPETGATTKGEHAM